MNDIKIKICGITQVETMVYADPLVDWVGLVFYDKSPRNITIEQAAALSSYKKNTKLMALFVKPSNEQIKQVLSNIAIDSIQLYDTEERGYQIQQNTGLPVWLSKSISCKEDLPTTCLLSGLVIEPKVTSNMIPGGNGISFDWNITKDWEPPVPWMLAGGLNSSNVQEAINKSNTSIVDVSSGIESSLGIKSNEKIQSFINSIKKGT